MNMNKIRKPLSFLLAVVMIISMFAAAPFTASAEDGYTEYELALGLPNPDAIKDCTYHYRDFYYANVPIIDLDQDEIFSTLPDGDIVVWPEGSGIAVVDAKGYAYKFYDNTGVELPASMTDNETGSGSELGLSADVTLYRKIFSITYTQAALDSEALYIVATAPATDPDVENVIALIDAIGTVEYTDASKEKIDAARAAYDALSDDQKALVTNADALTTAETAYAALELAQAKTDAKDTLDNYKNAADYREAQQTELANAITEGKEAIDAAADTDAVAAALANAKTAIDAIKTDAELTAEEELADAKADAKAELDSYKNAADYREAQQTELANAIADGEQAIDAATTVAEVNTALANAKTAIDAIKTDAQLTAEELAVETQDFMSVRIDDQIYIKYILHNRDGLESVTVTYYDQDGVKELQEKRYTVDELTFDGNGMFEILAEVAPAQIGDKVTVTITTTDGSDPTTYETSIANYCKHLIANYDGENAAAVKALAAATLEYGQAANNYFAGMDYYTATTFADTEKAQAAVADAAGLENHMSVNANGKIQSISYMAVTKPEFRFYVNPDSGLTEADYVALNDKITVNCDNANVLEKVSAKFVKNIETGAILLEVTGIEAANMDEIITITIDGFGTITFCGNDFARLLAKNDSTATLGAALYLYGVAAKALFA